MDPSSEIIWLAVHPHRYQSTSLNLGRSIGNIKFYYFSWGQLHPRLPGETLPRVHTSSWPTTRVTPSLSGAGARRTPGPLIGREWSRDPDPGCSLVRERARVGGEAREEEEKTKRRHKYLIHFCNPQHHEASQCLSESPRHTPQCLPQSVSMKHQLSVHWPLMTVNIKTL